MNYFTVLTHIGAAKIAAATANKTLVELTHIAIGDGSGTTPLPEASQTQLVNEVFGTAVNELKIDEQNNSHVIVRSILPSNEGNFWIREVGVYDKDGDLIAVGNYPETYKPMLSDGVAKEVDLQVIFEVTNSDVVNLMIDPSIVMASQEYVNEKLIEKLNTKDHLNFITANCLLDGEITSTQNDLTNTLDILGDGSCVACYPLDNNTNDLSGNNHATATNVVYENTKYGQGVLCSGTSNKIDTGLLESDYPEITFSMHMKNGSSWFLGARENNDVNGTSLHIYDADGFIRLTGLSDGIGWNLSYIDTDVPYETDRFYHIVVSISMTEIKIYIDGMLKATWSGSTRIYSGGNWHFCSAGINNQSFSGTIDHVRIFNKILTLSEIQLLTYETFLSDVSLNNAEVVYSNGKSRGYDLRIESIDTKDISALTFQKGWNEVIKTKEGDYTVTQQLSYMAEESNGSDGNRFFVYDGKYYDKNGIHLENQAPILHVLYDGMNIIEVKRVMDFVGLLNNEKEVNYKIVDFKTINNANKYLMTNPFGNENWEKCIVKAEIYANNRWSETGWSFNAVPSPDHSTGVKAISNEEGIVVQTGRTSLLTRSDNLGGGHGYEYGESELTSALCRVIVYKVGN